MKKIFFAFILMTATWQTFAQSTNTVVIGGPGKGDDNATAEVLSQNGTKGFMPPRFTTAQITTLQAQLTIASKGLIVFNTDENCLKSWLGDKWSECQENNQAQYTVVSSQVEGDYFVNTETKGSNIIRLKVDVTKTGLYDIGSLNIANNDRDFISIQNAAGFFSTTGEQEIILNVHGIYDPIDNLAANRDYSIYNNYNNTNYNGALTPLSTISISFQAKPVAISVAAQYTIQRVNVFGNYYYDTPVDGSNYIQILLNVTKPGLYNIETGELGLGNLVGFSSMGYFSEGTQMITLFAKGIYNSNFIEDFSDTSFNMVLYNNFDIDSREALEIFDISISGNFKYKNAKYQFDGTRKEGKCIVNKPLDGTNAIIVQATIKELGLFHFTGRVYDLGSIVSETNHATFDSGLINITELGPQEIRLYGQGVFDQEGFTTINLFDVLTPQGLKNEPIQFNFPVNAVDGDVE